MKFRTNFTDGTLTVGEAKVSVGMMTDLDPQNIEAFVVLAYNHRAHDDHELIICSNLGEDRQTLDRLLYLAHYSANHGDVADDIPPEISLLGTILRSTWLRIRSIGD